MSNINKQALRGQSVEGSYYLAECGHCGEMYPSNKLDGGESLFSGDYGECFCHLCGADDSDIADNGAWGSEAVTAWNYQQKRIEALLDENYRLTAERDALRENIGGDNTRAAADIYFQLVEECEIPAGGSLVEYVDDMREKLEAAEKRIAELEAKLDSADKLQDSAFRHDLQHGFSYGQTDDQAGFEKAIQAYGQQ
ncbi:ead/Ea22-like family protein [Escherichia coli]|nr:ead/Ea22-like family protein [Escherichia coli]